MHVWSLHSRIYSDCASQAAEAQTSLSVQEESRVKALHEQLDALQQRRLRDIDELRQTACSEQSNLQREQQRSEAQCEQLKHELRDLQAQHAQVASMRHCVRSI